MQPAPETFMFGRFRLQPEQRLLLADGVPVTLTPRAFDILEFLVRNRDRIVRRDEIVAHVWRGVTVGENNLSVQISMLRRTMAPYCGRTPLIANLPGRGYRFIAEVETPDAGQIALPEGLAGVTAHIPAAEMRVIAPRWRRPAVVVPASLLLMAVIFLIGMNHVMSPFGSGPIVAGADGRLSIRVESFSAAGGDPRETQMASRYYNTVLSRLLIFRDLKLFPATGQAATPEAAAPTPHFRLTGTADIVGADLVVTVRLLEAPAWQTVDMETRTVPLAAADTEHSAAAMHLVAGIRPTLFAQEKLLGARHAKDGLALLIDAHVAAGDTHHPAKLEAAIRLARRAVATDPSLDAARAYLALLLAEWLQLQDARIGDAAGHQAVALIDDVLSRDKLNPVFVAYRALGLASLNDLGNASLSVERGLGLDPSFYYLVQLEGEILMQQNHLDEAAKLIRNTCDNPQDDRLGILAYAQGDYPTALSRFQKVLGEAEPNWDTPFTRLLQTSTQIRLGQAREARDTLRLALSELAPAFHQVASLRQSYYALPDGAWQQFLGDLRTAGMPSGLPVEEADLRLRNGREVPP